MEPRLQPGSDSPRRRFTRRSASGIPNQHFLGPHVLPRNLFPHDGKTGVGQSNRPELADNLQNCKRRHHRKASTKRKAGKVERVSRRNVSACFLNTKRPRFSAWPFTQPTTRTDSTSTGCKPRDGTEPPVLSRRSPTAARTDPPKPPSGRHSAPSLPRPAAS